VKPNGIGELPTFVLGDFGQAFLASEADDRFYGGTRGFRAPEFNKRPEFPITDRAGKHLHSPLVRNFKLTLGRRLLVWHDVCVCLPEPHAQARQVRVREPPGWTASSHVSSILQAGGAPSRLSCYRIEQQTGHVAICSTVGHQGLQNRGREDVLLHHVAASATCGSRRSRETCLVG
jgi:hypothetical protein